MIGSSQQSGSARKVALGSLLFKLIGAIMILPWIKPLAAWIGHYNFNAFEVVIYFHVFYNLLRCLVMLPFVAFMPTSYSYFPCGGRGFCTSLFR